MSYNVVRVGWGEPRVIATFDTKEEAEKDRLKWETQAEKDFKEGRVMYDDPTFVVESSEGSLCLFGVHLEGACSHLVPNP